MHAWGVRNSLENQGICWIYPLPHVVLVVICSNCFPKNSGIMRFFLHCHFFLLFLLEEFLEVEAEFLSKQQKLAFCDDSDMCEMP